MDASYLFQLFLDQFSLPASFLAITSFLYVMLGRSKSFHFHRIPRLILSVVIGLYSAPFFDLSRIIGIAVAATTIGLGAHLVWHGLLARGKTLQQSVQVPSSSNLPADIIKKILEAVTKK